MADYVSDATLLERFVTCREEAAFAVLVERHGPQVLGACRRILRDEHDAEDAFQATFLLLARKAGVLPWRESVGGWLCAVARRLSLIARAGAARRCLHERPLSALAGAGTGPRHDASFEDPRGVDPLSEIARRELRRVLVDELEGLPEKYRAPVVLCYLEGMTNEEAARRLGWPAGSMSRRLERARSLLRHRLAGRGLSLAVILILAIVAAIGTRREALRDSRGHVSVREALSPFKPREGGSHGHDLERLLALVSRSERSATGRRDVLMAAGQTALAAEQIARLDPGRQGEQWRHYADEMRQSALLLAQAAHHEDDPAIRAAAERLSASCIRCHEVFCQ
jgi:RNA polymerase sigma-70 factor (ECF subfamily)